MTTTTILVNSARLQVPVKNIHGEELSLTVTIENLVVTVPPERNTVQGYVEAYLRDYAMDEAWDSPHELGNGGEYSIIEDAVPYISQLETTSREEAQKLFQKWNSVAAKYRRQLDLMDQAT